MTPDGLSRDGSTALVEIETSNAIGNLIEALDIRTGKAQALARGFDASWNR